MGRRSQALLSVGLAVTFLTIAAPAGATTAKPPTVSGFTASPSTLYNDGGIVTLLATVANARSCRFSSKKSVTGLPATVSCTSGVVSETVTVPANTGTTNVTYKFKLAVAGTTTVDAKPVDVIVDTSAPPGGLKGVRSMASDDDGYCAVLTSGSIECWGDNSFGELGIGSGGGPDGSQSGDGGYDTPQTVAGITDAASISSDGDDDYCAVLTTGSMDCWGGNGDGNLGNGTTNNSVLPVPVTGITDARSVANDGFGYCAVLTTGRMDCWGLNLDGELGNGAYGGPDGESYNDTPQAVTGITNALSAASDSDYGYCAVLSSGGVDCWGYNFYGQVGNGTWGLTGSDPAGGYDTPQAVIGITNAASVTSDGSEGFCAVLLSGGVDCWGVNSLGELGNGTTVSTNAPVPVTGITNAVFLSNLDFSFCAVLRTGGVDCWGDNGVGELGDGTTGNGVDTPQAVPGVTTAISIATDQYSYCVVLSTGGSDCWAINYYGEFGNGTVGGPDGQDGYDSPQAVTGITNAVSFANDGFGYCAVLSTTAVDCWGYNGDGELGNGTINGPDGEYGYDTPQVVSAP